MRPPPDHVALLNRMEAARWQTQHQLDVINRQITRRMTPLITGLLPRRVAYRRGKPPDPKSFLERYRAQLAALTAERQPEIDALSRKLARQDRAISDLRLRHGVSGLFAPYEGRRTVRQADARVAWRARRP